MRRLALIALLTSAPSFAQVSVSLFQYKGQENLKFNAASCSDDPGELRIEGSVTGQYNLLFNAYPFGLTEGKCPLTLNLVPPLGVTLAIEAEQLSNPTNPIFSDSTVTPAALVGAACATPVRKQTYVCAQFVEASSDGTTAEDLGEGVGLLVVDIDTTVPVQATVTGVSGGDGVVLVNVDAIESTEGDVTSFRVEHRLCPVDGEVVETPAADSTCGAAEAFLTTTGAALMCTHHMNLRLYGGPWDALVCGAGIAVTAGVSVARAVTDNHYATDILTGAVVGSLIGWLVPTAFHYGFDGKGVGANRLKSLPMPTATAHSLGLVWSAVL